MKNLLKFLIMSAVVLSINSCDKEDDDNPEGCVKEVVVVDVSVDVATTWDSCHIYHVVGFLGLNATLTIEAGTIVKFGAQKGIVVQTTGNLIVAGNAEHPVIFTSLKDDNYGGDTNGDGAATSPQKGDWQFITLGSSSDNVFDNCKVFYAGYGSANAEQAVNMGSGGSNSFINSVIAHTAGGVDQQFAALNMSWCPQSCSVTNNTFYDNGHPLIIGISSDVDDSNTFHNPANASETNLCNGIFVDCVHSADQATTMTWSETEVAFVLGGWSSNSWSMDGAQGKSLVLGDNVVIKFARFTNPGFSILMPDGSTQLQNFDGPGVAYTAYTDDSRKGDTNGDGPSTGSPAYWEGISTVGINWYDWPNMYFVAPH